MGPNAKQDVEPITGSVGGVTPLTAARLCNFSTGGKRVQRRHGQGAVFKEGTKMSDALNEKPNAEPLLRL